MNQTFYGVDIILLPEGERGSQLHEQGKVIEINGLNSGASFYRIGDTDYYHRAMRELGSSLESKLMLIPYDPESSFKRRFSPESKKALEEAYIEKAARIRQWQAQLADNPENNFFSVHDFSIDKVKWERETMERFKTNLQGLYLQAARELGLRVEGINHAVFFGGLVKYQVKRLDPRFLARFGMDQSDMDKPIAELDLGDVPPSTVSQHFVPLEAIGLSWTDFSKMDEIIVGRERLLNGFFEERILGDKALLYGYSELLPEGERPLEPFLPRSILYGLGLHTQEGFRAWLDSVDGDLFVKKPLFEAHGIGVEFMKREEMQAYDRSPFHHPHIYAVEEGYRRLMMDFMLAQINLGHETVIFQEGIKGQPLVDEETGQQRYACARAIVINGKYMGTMWRSTKPEPGMDLTRQLRHNTTYGSEVLPVSDEDSRLIGEIAEASVSAFERTNESVRDRLTDVKVPYLDLYHGSKSFDAEIAGLIHTFYLSKIKRAVEASGIDLVNSLRGWVVERSAGSQIQSSEFVDKVSTFYHSL